MQARGILAAAAGAAVVVGLVWERGRAPASASEPASATTRSETAHAVGPAGGVAPPRGPSPAPSRGREGALAPGPGRRPIAQPVDLDWSADGSATAAAAASPAPPVSEPGALPATLEEALAGSPALAADLACRDPTARFDMAYDLRMMASLRSCLAGKTHSTGTLTIMLLFDNDPATRRGVGTGVEPRSSTLAPEDDEVVLDCLRAFVVGSVLESSEKFGKGKLRARGNSIALPLEDSRVYRQVRAGTYTPGHPGCDYP